MMHKYLLGFALGLAVISGAAKAQNANNQLVSPVSRPHENLPNFDVETLQPLLAEMNISSQVAVSPEGDKALFAKDSGGLSFILHPRDCQNAASDCYSVITFALFKGEFNAQSVSAFNAKSAAVGAFVDSDGDVVINRYDVNSFGFPRGTFADLMIVFIKNGVGIYNELYSVDQTVSLERDETDLAAAYLNARQIAAFSGGNDYAVNALSDGAYATIRVLKDSVELPKNKIENFTGD